MAQLSSAALRIRAEQLRAELGRSTLFHQLLLHYAHDVLSEISRAFVCHRVHSTAQRLSGWLLSVGDRAGSDSPRVIAIAQVIATSIALALRADGRPHRRSAVRTRSRSVGVRHCRRTTVGNRQTPPDTAS
jgi:hypothetical protein